jgi:hypothetical protein
MLVRTAVNAFSGVKFEGLSNPEEVRAQAAESPTITIRRCRSTKSWEGRLVMKLLGAAALVAFPLAAFAQIQGPDHQSLEGNGGTAGAATSTVVLPPAGGIADTCTNVTSCASFIATPPAGSNGAQVSHVTAPPNGAIESQCINSPECSTFLGR